MTCKLYTKNKDISKYIKNALEENNKERPWCLGAYESDEKQRLDLPMTIFGHIVSPY